MNAIFTIGSRKNLHRLRPAFLLPIVSIATLFSFTDAALWNRLLPREKAGSPGYRLATASSGTLSLMTYNIAGLPQFISSAAIPRDVSIAAIGQLVSSYDIIHVQEDFNYNRFLCANNKSHGFRTAHPGGVPFGDGLTILSKYPFAETRRIAWRNCSGADCLTPKGFMYTRVQLARGVFVDFYNLHATAEKNPRASTARKKNLQQLAQFIREQSIGNAVVVMGDFNAHYAYVGDNMQHFLEETGLEDAWLNLLRNGTVPPKTDTFEPPPNLSLDTHVESLDKILYRGNHRISFTARGYRVERNKFVNDLGLELSDHLPISLQLDWKMIK